MTEARKKEGKDPSVVSTDYTTERELLRDVAGIWRERTTEDGQEQLDKDMRQLTKENGSPDDPDYSEDPAFGNEKILLMNFEEIREVYKGRVTMAMIGGLFIIGPMLVMVLHPGLVTSLVTTSVCVFLCGLAMSMVLFERPYDVIAGTAAYAAVLVVFIGTGAGA